MATYFGTSINESPTIIMQLSRKAGASTSM